jgi:tyrosyl-tRNA synthetase
VVITVPLLEGLEGVEKMSKSLGNAVGITEAPEEMFGKLMSISDELMWRYYELLTNQTAGDIAALKDDVAAGRVHPKQAKAALAGLVVGDFHGEPAARQASESFEARFGRGKIAIEALPQVVLAIDGEFVTLTKVIVGAGLAASASEATRKIQQGGVRIDRERVTDGRHRLTARQAPIVLEVGRRAVLVTLRQE